MERRDASDKFVNDSPLFFEALDLGRFRPASLEPELSRAASSLAVGSDAENRRSLQDDENSRVTSSTSQRSEMTEMPPESEESERYLCIA